MKTIKSKFIQLFKVVIFLLLTIDSFGQKNSFDNYSDSIPEIPLVGLSKLDSIINNYTVFFTGENHTYANQNSNIELQMLKYLNEKANVKNLIIELGFSRGYMLNKYINDDTSYYQNLQGTTSSKYLKFYKKLREFNQTLPLEKRIRVEGVDIERFADDGPVLLNKLLPKNTSIPKEIEFQIEVLKSYAYYISVKYKSYYNDDDNVSYISNAYNYYGRGFNNVATIDSMIADYKLNRAIYQSYIGNQFELFDKVFNSIIEYRKWQNYQSMPHQYIYRERMIYDNLSKLITENPNERYYGQFGRCHVSQTELNNECNWYAFNSTAKRLNEGVAKGKTLSIGIFYQNGYSSTSHFFEDAASTQELKKYLDIDCTDENMIEKISNVDTLISKHFQFIIINNTNCKNKAKLSKYANKPKDNGYDYHEWAVMLDFGQGKSYFNLNNLSSKALVAPNKFNNWADGFNIGYTYSDFGNYNVGKFEYFGKQTAQNGSTKYTLNGYSVQEGFGYSPHISNRFTFGAYGLLGFQRLALNVENDSLKNSISPGFSISNRYKFVNNGISVGAGLDLRFAITSFLGIYARGKYMIDISSKNWNLRKSDFDINSPRTSLSNYGLTLGLSILIQE